MSQQVSTIEERIAAKIDNEVAGQLVVSDAAGGLSFVNVGQVMEFAKMMAISAVAVPKHLRGNPGACLGVCIQAIEWRMSPYAVANKSYSVNDRLAYEAQLIQAVILSRAPIKGRFHVEYKGEGDKRICRAWAELADGTGITEYTSPEFGKIQPKNSPLWKTDPDQQHWYYSVRALCRRHFPDVLLGVYAKDEIDDSTPRNTAAARDVTPRPKLAGALDMLGKKQPAPVEHDEDGVVIENEATTSKPDTEQALHAQSSGPAAEAGATSSPRRASAAPKTEKAGAPVALTVSVAKERGRDDAMRGRERSEVPADVQAAGMSIAWLEGHDEVTDVVDGGEISEEFNLDGRD